MCVCKWFEILTFFSKMASQCIFAPCTGSDSKSNWKASYKTGIETITNKRLEIADGLHEKLEGMSQCRSHKSCYSSYTSRSRNIPSTSSSSSVGSSFSDNSSKRLSRSDIESPFVLKGIA